MLFPVTTFRAAMKPPNNTLPALQAEGTQQSLLDTFQTRAELYDLLDYEDFDQRDRDYFGDRGPSDP